MSYLIINEIKIADKKVFVTSASSSLHRRIFETYEVKQLSDILGERGIQGVLSWIAQLYRDGEYRLSGQTYICRIVREEYKKLPSVLRSFLDDERLGEYVGECAAARFEKKRINRWERHQELDRLRYDKAAVLEICKKRPQAFQYADADLQKDREVAESYIEQCADDLFFEFPKYYESDKELIIKALKKNGCLYRKLNDLMKQDRDLILLAFDSSIQRRFVEHLPDVIPTKIRKDREFVKKLLDTGIHIHINRAPELVEDREAALIWVKKGKYVLADLYVLKKEYLEEREFQDILIDRFSEPSKMESLQQKFKEAGVKLSYGRVA